MGKLREEEIGKNQDPFIGYVVQYFEDLILCNIKTNEISPTWRNFRSGIDGVSKSLTEFLVLESVLEDSNGLKSWVRYGGGSDHIIYTATKARLLQI